ncbi:MAG: response regulator [Deltaproteobacteria bacterium]|nr:response regulator [Deltaproteobacteria bacterium]
MPYRILVVDDEQSIRATVTDYLEGLGYEVQSAIDVEQGIEAVRSFRPHLALVDFLLPKKNGFAVAEAIRKDPLSKDAVLIMMSGVFKNPRTGVEARDRYQAVDFLSKPLDLEQLGLLIRESLAGVNSASVPAASSAGASSAGWGSGRWTGTGTGTGTATGTGSGTGSGRGHWGASGTAGTGTGTGTGGAPRSRPRSTRGGAYVRSVEVSAAALLAEDRALYESEGHAAEGEIINGVYHGRPFPAIVAEATLDEFPIAMLLSILRYDGLTGMLDLTDEGTHRRIYVIEGNPSFMQSNAEGENVGALLLRRGRVTDPDFQRCLAYMKEKNRTLQQSLLELRLVSEQDLATAYKLLAGQLLPSALAMASGTFRWRETDAFVGRVPEGKFEPVAVLFDGIRRHVHPPQILRFFRGFEDVAMVKTTEFDHLLPFFRRAFSASNIASKIDGRMSYRTFTRDESSSAAMVIPQLYALVTSGMVVLPEIEGEERDRDGARGRDPSLADLPGSLDDVWPVLPREDSSLSLEFTADTFTGTSTGPRMGTNSGATGPHSEEALRARRAVHDFHERVLSENFFEVLGVTEDTAEDAIKAAYFELTKRWSADAFAEIDLGSARQDLEAIFQRITEAYETITDRRKRGDYIAYLDRKAKGMPTDIDQVMRAERLFEQGQAMIRRREWENACAVLREATALNPGEPSFFAYLGWATYKHRRKSQDGVTEAVNLLRKAVSEQENLAVAYQFLGSIAYARGQGAEAIKWWQRCLDWEPGNVEAARGLRMIAQRPERDASVMGNLLGRFISKKP